MVVAQTERDHVRTGHVGDSCAVRRPGRGRLPSSRLATVEHLVRELGGAADLHVGRAEITTYLVKKKRGVLDFQDAARVFNSVLEHQTLADSEGKNE